ncbi:hypothetical protein ACAG26_06290 [Mycobacterium sp. pUA109]|uniref:hypothetical protein n=1 Tax=Mycobacterium sp. pUA109 TaxID=3238982 RepID=UPI00351AFD08
MRTTLDLDDRVLAAARSRARARGISIGQAVSELALDGIEAQAEVAQVSAAGFPMLPAVPGHLITDQMVEDALADV